MMTSKKKISKNKKKKRCKPVLTFKTHDLGH